MEDPALLEMVRQDLRRYEQGKFNPTIFSDPVASELAMVEELKSEGLTDEEAQEAARQFHAFREDLATLTLQGGQEERTLMAQEFKEALEERLAARQKRFKKDHQSRQESIRRRTEERIERREGGPQQER